MNPASPSHGRIALTLPPFPAALRNLIRRLPVAPPSFALATALNRVWWPLVDAATRRDLAGKIVEIEIRDVGIRCRLIAEERGLKIAARGATPTVRLVADALTYWKLIQGQDDPDKLFFERALVMEGDTEYGLLLKNTIDAVGPPVFLKRR